MADGPGELAPPAGPSLGIANSVIAGARPAPSIARVDARAATVGAARSATTIVTTARPPRRPRKRWAVRPPDAIIRVPATTQPPSFSGPIALTKTVQIAVGQSLTQTGEKRRGSPARKFVRPKVDVCGV
jgi:hypothetical protein